MSQQWTGWTPILRVADATASIEFYRDVLGFQEDWVHRFEAEFPAYASVSRDPLILHLPFDLSSTSDIIAKTMTP